MHRILQRIVGEERGVALVMALIIMAALAGTTAALVLPGAVNQRNSLKSADARQAFALAETSLAYGEGAVYAAVGVIPTTLADHRRPARRRHRHVAGDDGQRRLQLHVVDHRNRHRG